MFYSQSGKSSSFFPHFRPILPRSFFLVKQVEKDKARMKVGARMFRKGLESEVFKLEAGGLLNGTTSAQMG